MARTPPRSSSADWPFAPFAECTSTHSRSGARQAQATHDPAPGFARQPGSAAAIPTRLGKATPHPPSADGAAPSFGSCDACSCRTRLRFVTFCQDIDIEIATLHQGHPRCHGVCLRTPRASAPPDPGGPATFNSAPSPSLLNVAVRPPSGTRFARLSPRTRQRIRRVSSTPSPGGCAHVSAPLIVPPASAPEGTRGHGYAITASQEDLPPLPRPRHPDRGPAAGLPGQPPAALRCPLPPPPPSCRCRRLWRRHRQLRGSAPRSGRLIGNSRCGRSS